jgi:hypothetical protein
MWSSVREVTLRVEDVTFSGILPCLQMEGSSSTGVAVFSRSVMSLVNLRVVAAGAISSGIMYPLVVKLRSPVAVRDSGILVDGLVMTTDNVLGTGLLCVLSFEGMTITNATVAVGALQAVVHALPAFCVVRVAESRLSAVNVSLGGAVAESPSALYGILGVSSSFANGTVVYVADVTLTSSLQSMFSIFVYFESTIVKDSSVRVAHAGGAFYNGGLLRISGADGSCSNATFDIADSETSTLYSVSPFNSGSIPALYVADVLLGGGVSFTLANVSVLGGRVGVSFANLASSVSRCGLRLVATCVLRAGTPVSLLNSTFEHSIVEFGNDTQLVPETWSAIFVYDVALVSTNIVGTAVRIGLSTAVTNSPLLVFVSVMMRGCSIDLVCTLSATFVGPIVNLDTSSFLDGTTFHLNAGGPNCTRPSDLDLLFRLGSLVVSNASHVVVDIPTTVTMLARWRRLRRRSR